MVLDQVSWFITRITVGFMGGYIEPISYWGPLPGGKEFGVELRDKGLKTFKKGDLDPEIPWV